MDLILVRHARPIRVEGSEGRADPALSDLGREQADAAAAWLAHEHIDIVISSPLRRALETANPIAKAQGIEITVEPGLQEYDADSPSYIHYEELKANRDPRFLALVQGQWDEIAPEGAMFRETVVKTLEQLIADNPGKRIAAVCHGAVINVCLSNVLGLERDLFFEPEYASVSRIVASRQGVRSIRSINETGHLRNVGPD